MKFGGQALWHHLQCFVEVRGDYGFYVGGEQLEGYRDLSLEDKKMVKKTLQ
jgi:poly [ADP-ribose] polymerase 1